MLIKISVLRENTKLKFQLVLLYIQNKTFLINFLKVIETFPPWITWTLNFPNLTCTTSNQSRQSHLWTVAKVILVLSVFLLPSDNFFLNPESRLILFFLKSMSFSKQNAQPSFKNKFSNLYISIKELYSYPYKNR